MRTLYRARQNKDGSVRIEECITKSQAKWTMYWTPNREQAMRKGLVMLGRHIKKRQREQDKLLTNYRSILQGYRNVAFDHSDKIAEGVL